MKKKQPKLLNLNALKIIHMLVTTGSVTRTARHLNVSTGTISYQLKKIRHLTGAHLFTRTANGMLPDAMAMEFSQRYCDYLLTQTSSDRPGPLICQQSSLRINADVPVEMILAGTTHSTDKKYIFDVKTDDPVRRLARLRNDEIQLDIGSGLSTDTDMLKIRLFSSRVVGLTGTRYPPLSETLSLDDWYQYRHAIWLPISHFYSQDLEKAAHTQRHLQRRNEALASDSIISLAVSCSDNPFLMLVPECYAGILTSTFKVQAHTLPEDLDMFYDVYLHFCRRLFDDQNMKHLLSELIADIENYSGSASGVNINDLSQHGTADSNQ